MTFNPFKSTTILGAIVAAIGFLTQPNVLALFPAKVAAIIVAIGGILTAFGLRSAIAANGVGSTAAAADKHNGVG